MNNSICISSDTSIIEALKKLNYNQETLTLFVVDNNNKLIGTLTDGDIRRGFINNLTLSNDVSSFMARNFHYITNYSSLHEFRSARKKGIRLLPLLDDSGQILKIFDLKKTLSNLPLEAMIMAGGRGERLRPLTDNIPKPMLMLGNKPIIEHNIDRLISYGIEKIYISIRYLGEQIIEYFGDGSSKGIKIEYITEDQPLGTAGALSLVSKFNTDYIIVMNSDLFTDVDIEDLYLNTIKFDAVMGVSTVPYTTKVPYGIFTTNQNQVIGLIEKPVFTNYANAGIYILQTNIISNIPHNSFYNITDLMEHLIGEKLKIVHNPIVGYWIDIGQHQDYKNAQEIAKHLKNVN